MSSNDKMKLEQDVCRNAVKSVRESLLMSKSELARKAGVSPLTIDRVEKGMRSQVATKRKIILALGYELSEKDKIFPEPGKTPQKKCGP